MRPVTARSRSLKLTPISAPSPEPPEVGVVMISNLLRCATGADGCTQDLSLIGGFSVEKLCLGHTAISANIFGTSSNRARTSQTDQVLTPCTLRYFANFDDRGSAPASGYSRVNDGPSLGGGGSGRLGRASVVLRVPVDGFFRMESPQNGSPFGIAGIWENGRIRLLVNGSPLLRSRPVPTHSLPTFMTDAKHLSAMVIRPH